MNITKKFHVRRKEKRRKTAGPVPEVEASVPRMAKLMALAIRFEQLVRDGEVADYAIMPSWPGWATCRGRGSRRL